MSLDNRGPHKGSAGAQEQPATTSSRVHLICQKWCVDLNGRILELLNQFRARRSAYFSRPRACLKNRGHCVPQILVVIQEGLRVAVPLKDKTLGVVAVEVQLVLQSPGVFRAHQFRAFRGETLPLSSNLEASSEESPD